MRWRFLVLAVVVALGCRPVPTAADFEFADADAGLAAEDVASDALAGDVGDVQVGLDVEDVADASDVVDALDAFDVAASSDAPDSADVPGLDASTDVPDVVDSLGAPDVADVLDAIDVSSPDAPSLQDIVDVAASLDAGADAVADVPLDAVDVSVDVGPDIPADPCAGKNCDDGNACTTDSCSGGTCQWAQLPDWTSCGEGMVCDGEGMCADVKVAKGMAYIPAGTFWMGCNATKDTNCNSSETPQHKVTLSAYYMDLTETTVTQYKACVDAGVCTVPSHQSPSQYATYPGFPNNPVNFVNWTQSQQYCQWRGAGFDLPTEAQWEMAAKGNCEKNGSTAGDAGCASAMRTYPWGEPTATCSYAVMYDGTNDGCGANATWAVGSKTAGDSPYGLHDMAGNVWEWTRDWYSWTYYGSSSATDPYDSASASSRVYRGGGFGGGAVDLRAGHRDFSDPSAAANYIGLRCIRTYP